jgi:tRNA(Ile)-lysidine synthase
MVLAHICWSAGMNIGIAHCNFNLRGEESTADELFVKQWAQARHIPFYTTAFDTKNYAHANGLSTQMAARDLRYEWFENLRTTEQYTHIAVAHHADDNAETLFINLARGTGLKGLCGMQPLNGNIVRPLLFATRNEIEKYAAENNVPHREDASNATDDYTRNRIRHKVIPELQKINPSVVHGLSQTANHLKQAYDIITAARKKIATEWCTLTGTELHLSINAIKHTAHNQFWLFELLQPYNFSGAVVAEIMQAMDKQTGKRFYSATHELIKDRASLIVLPLQSGENTGEILIDEVHQWRLTAPVALQFEVLKNTETLTINRDKNSATLALEKLQLPLTLRLWQEGDCFMPFGMKGMKKVSDFLIDEKVPLSEKARQYVLLSGTDIIWLVGRRIDERYKITPHTQNILVISKQ